MKFVSKEAVIRELIEGDVEDFRITKNGARAWSALRWWLIKGEKLGLPMPPELRSYLLECANAVFDVVYAKPGKKGGNVSKAKKADKRTDLLVKMRLRTRRGGRGLSARTRVEEHELALFGHYNKLRKAQPNRTDASIHRQLAEEHGGSQGSVRSFIARWKRRVAAD